MASGCHYRYIKCQGEKSVKLSELHPRQKAIIKSIGDIGELKNRLMELGVLCGEPVQVVRIAPLGGDPIEIRIGDEHLALRSDDAKRSKSKR